ncbi:unnamed protein product [Leptosia nina]|uniref:Uncharacterized protein n=1 Tax=Leptosia nina TaxID=320188 RepID=A0AAV1JIL3_9NEOP
MKIIAVLLIENLTSIDQFPRGSLEQVSQCILPPDISYSAVNPITAENRTRYRIIDQKLIIAVSSHKGQFIPHLGDLACSVRDNLLSAKPDINGDMDN